MAYLFETLFSLLREFFPFGLVEPWERGLHVRLGKKVKEVGPGVCLVLPFIDQLYTINTRRQITNLPAQSVQTQDLKSFMVSGAIEYEITDVKKIWLNLQDHDESMVELAQSAIATVIGCSKSGGVTIQRIEAAACARLRQEQSDWGVEIYSVRLSDLDRVKSLRILTDT